MSPASSLFPALPIWAQQLASILPLTALIDFVDVASELHVYELRSSVPRWNWPVTPVGARLLLSNEDTSEACCLDKPERSVILDCFDARHGDRYPCSTPTTTRLWASTQAVSHKIKNDHPNMQDKTARKQVLEIFHVRDLPPLTPSDSASTPGIRSLFRRFLSYLRARGVRYNIVAFSGWLCWIALVILSFLKGLYIAGAYLSLMPLTGSVVFFTHGGKPRLLIRRKVGVFPRLVVAAGSVNAVEWWAFYGDQTLVNSLVNLPLMRRGSVRGRNFSRWVLRIVIAGQWALALASCSRQGWDAFIISMWIAFCTFTSAYGYPSNVAARDWLRRDCRIAVEKIQTELSSRRSMLSALVCVNPDSERTNWMDPILAPSPERKEEVAALLKFLKDRRTYEETESKYWWKYMLEGVEVGDKIKNYLETKSGVTDIDLKA